MRCSKKCSNCKFYYLQDEGYSNYTVMETVAHCMKNEHPKLPASASYKWEQENHEILNYAQKCSFFEEGSYVRIDVERENMDWNDNDYSLYCEDKEQVKALHKYLNVQQ